jgi:hypothetical protein
MEDEKKIITPQDLAAQSRGISPWFDWYMNRLNNHSVIAPQQEGVTYHCPCCGYRTLPKRGGYDICPICFWEDDGQDEQDADVVRGGPNGNASLTAARENFRAFGASLERRVKHVRPPLPEEL